MEVPFDDIEETCDSNCQVVDVYREIIDDRDESIRELLKIIERKKQEIKATIEWLESLDKHSVLMVYEVISTIEDLLEGLND